VLSPHEDVVRVMTIHKSKGLEFPVVFVMGLEESFSRRDRSELAAHAKLGVALPYVNEEMRTTSDTMLKAAINLRRQAEEKAERARLLYVAMTRAQEELILLGCAQDAIPQQIGAGTDEKDSAYAVFGAGSMLDWVRLCLDGRDVLEEATPEGVIDNPLWRNDQSEQLSTESTKTGGLEGGFPQCPTGIGNGASAFARACGAGRTGSAREAAG
jgi:ATP-dependent exoDNAse (exonuclease V) beta subunit